MDKSQSECVQERATVHEYTEALLARLRVGERISAAFVFENCNALAVDEHGITHGILARGFTGCHWDPKQKFRCPNCERFICYCMGHETENGALCPYCDECCNRVFCGGDSVE
jgi:hypothetical protein